VPGTILAGTVRGSRVESSTAQHVQVIGLIIVGLSRCSTHQSHITRHRTCIIALIPVSVIADKAACRVVTHPGGKHRQHNRVAAWSVNGGEHGRCCVSECPCSHLKCSASAAAKCGAVWRCEHSLHACCAARAAGLTVYRSVASARCLAWHAGIQRELCRACRSAGSVRKTWPGAQQRTSNTAGVQGTAMGAG
jgi:hypothetical protein